MDADRAIEHMKAADTGIALAAASMLLLGCSTFLYKKSTAAIGATNTTFYYYLFSVVLAAGVWLVYREKQPVSTTALLWPLAIAITLFLSVWTFNLALNHIDISLAATIRGLFFVVTLVLAVLLTPERPSALGMAGITLAVIALVLMGLGSRNR